MPRGKRGFTFAELLAVMVTLVMFIVVLGSLGCGVGRSNVSAGNGWGVSRSTVTVTEKWVKRGFGETASDEYIIVTRELGVMQSAQDPAKGKWESSDTYARLQPGHVYEVEWTGWRNAWAKDYPNVLRVVREVE